MIAENNAEGFVLKEVPIRTPEDALEERWFAERSSKPSLLPQRRSSVPAQRRSSVPPMGDDEVDPWLR
jgi:hypothetical protein